MSDLMYSGLELLVLGMGIVFVFLTILIFSLRGMSWLATRLDNTPATVGASPLPVTDAGAADTTLVAVISAAIARYRTAQKS